ncbi:MAG: hypothetical protein KDA80_03025 [Planctomycetaceae bacterium]|nr:hypothetical protein [Planctomycetaceae bacterium]
MPGIDLIAFLWSETWWRFDRQQAGFWGWLYHGFNIFEGTVWCVFAALVLKRWRQRHRAKWEPWYALTFFLFGLTDFREAYVQSAPLVLAKGVILALLLWQRHLIVRRTDGRDWF